MTSARRDQATAVKMPSVTDGIDQPVYWAAMFFGLAPFVLTIKLPPSASFWAEWTATLLAIALLLLGRRPPAAAATHHASLPVAALSLLVATALVSLQLLAGLPGFAGTALLAIALSALAATVSAIYFPGTRAEAALFGMLLSFVIYTMAVMWVFAVRSAWRAWLGLLLPAIPLAMAVLIHLYLRSAP